MGMYKRDLWQWQEAEREFQRAIQLNPNYAHAHSGYSGLLSLLGRHDEAIAEDNRARESDPVGVIINTVAGRTFHYARRYDEAIEYLKKTIELDQKAPFAHLRLGDVYATKECTGKPSANINWQSSSVMQVLKRKFVWARLTRELETASERWSFLKNCWPGQDTFRPHS